MELEVIVLGKTSLAQGSIVFSLKSRIWIKKKKYGNRRGTIWGEKRDEQEVE